MQPDGRSGVGMGSEVGSRKSEVGDRKSEVGGRKSEFVEKGDVMVIRSAKELDVYKKAYALSMEIFRVSKAWPVDERYSLTDQIRRSSRSVCANLREAWAKRRYEAHFLSKLSDCDGEAAETDTWLDYAKDCGYIDKNLHKKLTTNCRSVGSMLGAMIKNPTQFLSKS